MAHSRREFLKTAAGAAAASGTLAFPMVSRAQQKKLTVWWNRGYSTEEDEAMLKIAEDFRNYFRVGAGCPQAVERRIAVVRGGRDQG